MGCWQPKLLAASTFALALVLHSIMSGGSWSLGPDLGFLRDSDSLAADSNDRDDHESDAPSVEGAPSHQSIDGVDRYARDQFFNGRRKGTFIEVGAGSGDPRYSSSVALEQAGWRGILVEATSTGARELRLARPLAVVVQATVCDASQPVHFLEPEESFGVRCGAGAGIVEFMPDLFFNSWHPRAALESNGTLGGRQMTCASLSSVMRDVDILHTNFLTIDVVSAPNILDRAL